MRPPDRFRAAIGLLIAGAAGAAEPTPQQQLETVQKTIAADRMRQDEAAKSAAALGEELARLQAQSVAAAAAVAADDEALGATEARLAVLAAEDSARRAALANDGARQGALIEALIHVAVAPRPTFLLGGLPPVEAQRSAMLMRATLPALRAEAGGLEEELARITATRTAEEAARTQQQAERRALEDEKAQLGQMIAAKQALANAELRIADEAGQHLQALAAQAKNLHDLVDRIESERRKTPEAAAAQGRAVAMAMPHPPPAPGGKPFAEARGRLVFPVAGPVVARFGTLDENGNPRHGLTIVTRPGAPVVAPYDGEIEFAGPFRGYGQILIIAHGDGYHSLLAGLDRIDGSPGQRLVAGEPVGSMSDHQDKPQLYLELRHNNQPIDPLPWLMSRLEKVNG